MDIGIGDWDLGLRLGIRIGDLDWGSELGIGSGKLGIEIGGMGLSNGIIDADWGIK